jgi:hypothetical protein
MHCFSGAHQVIKDLLFRTLILQRDRTHNHLEPISLTCTTPLEWCYTKL